MSEQFKNKALSETPTQSPEKEVKISGTIAELEQPLRTIIEKIKPKIEAGEYGLFIGDDVSGRVPTIILGKIINAIYEARGFEKSKIIFIPGKLSSKTSTEEKLDKYLAKLGFDRKKKILIITDTVYTGKSLNTLVNLIHKLNLDCNIATIGLEAAISNLNKERRYTTLLDKQTPLRDVEIYSGEYKNTDGSKTPRIYKEKHKSGVIKEPGQEISQSYSKIYSGTFKNSPNWLFTQKKKEIQNTVNETRADAQIVTNKLVDWYLSNEQK